MRPFAYSRALNADDAVAAMSQDPDEAAHGGVKFLGGGTNLIDLMKMGVERPTRLIDITRLPMTAIEEHEGGVRIGAGARNQDAASHPLIRQHYPIVSQALLAGASPQLRNMATMGGNLMQRTRCFYFYDPAFTECNKRIPGSGCGAITGYNRIHAILGASDQCIATNPGDLSVALAALDAVVQVRGPRGERSIPIREFHRLPGEAPQIDTSLDPAELITAIDLPPLAWGARCHYLKVRDRNSYAFALVSVAAMVDLDGDRIRAARIALGGVAPKPWRVMEAEDALRGRQIGEDSYRAAADILLHGAKGYRDNSFKIELARRSIVRALSVAGEAV